MSSILSTSACGVGTHTTSLPSWPTCGWYPSCAACAKTVAAITDRQSASKDRRAKRDAFMAIFLEPAFLPIIWFSYLDAEEMSSTTFGVWILFLRSRSCHPLSFAQLVI